MKIALYQPVVHNNVEINLVKATSAMHQAARLGARLICYPEIQFSPFFPQYPARPAKEFLMTTEHPVMDDLQDACRKNRIVAVPNLYLEENGHPYDASPLIDADGRLLGISKMVHVVQVLNYYEQDYYTPSDSGFHVYTTSAGRIGIVICFDRHLPESIRTCTLMGAQLIVEPTANIKTEPLELFEWEMRVQAMQNGVFIAMCNRVGKENEMDFAGQSTVVDPMGNIVARADDSEQLLLADIDYTQMDLARSQRPYLMLRRPDSYKLDN